MAITVMQACAMALEIESGFNTRCVLAEGVKIHEDILNKPTKPFPKVGDKLTIRHQVKRSSSKGGDVLGLQRNDRPEAAIITAVYMDGTVRSGISDVWSVRPATNNSWETINPAREEF